MIHDRMHQLVDFNMSCTTWDLWWIGAPFSCPFETLKFNAIQLRYSPSIYGAYCFCLQLVDQLLHHVPNHISAHLLMWLLRWWGWWWWWWWERWWCRPTYLSFPTHPTDPLPLLSIPLRPSLWRRWQPRLSWSPSGWHVALEVHMTIYVHDENEQHCMLVH